MKEPMPPKFDYCLCESDPDVLILRLQDGAFVGAFSARRATREGIVQAAEEDYWALLEEHTSLQRGIPQRLSSEGRSSQNYCSTHSLGE